MIPLLETKSESYTYYAARASTLFMEPGFLPGLRAARNVRDESDRMYVRLAIRLIEQYVAKHPGAAVTPAPTEAAPQPRDDTQ